MTTLKFADTHNMVAFLSKPTESKGFKQIVDFATNKAKTVNGEVQLQALVDGKKIIITESTVKRDLQLEDADGVNCYPILLSLNNLIDAEHDSGNIDKTQSKATPNEPSSPELVQVVVPAAKKPWGIQLLRLEFLLWRLQRLLLANEIASFKRRVKKLERRNKSRTHRLKRLYKVGLSRRVESSKDEAKRAEEKRNRPPTRAQQRSIMCTYLKNMEGWKPKSLKNKSFANIQELFDNAMKRVNTFVDYRTELVEESSRKAETELVEESSKKAEAEIAHESSLKRAGEELEQESSKKQKLEEDKESEELKQCLEIVPNDGDDVTIDATPLSTKSPTIVDYKIYKEGKKSYFQIIRVDDNSQMYLTFGKMLKNFDREDLEVLWSIVKARFKKTEPMNYMDNFLLLNLKTMFEHHVKDNVWKNQQGLVKVLNWKLYDSCGVHCVTMQSMLFYLLVEKMYPLTNHTLHQMFNDVKLQVDYECEMAFKLLRLVKKQLKEGYVPK
ncbi:hypothetical protein Tco_1570587 [Tanacetum coccineum]